MKVKVLTITILSVLTVLLALFVFNTIKEPIQFQKEKNKRELAVKKQLIEIRKAQLLYKKINGVYAADFKELERSLTQDSFVYKNKTEGMDNAIVLKVAIIDTINSWGINLQTLGSVPFSEEKFLLETDTIITGGIVTPVIMCGTTVKNYMGEYADERFNMYDNIYDPEEYRKFGSLTEPSTNGNWK